MLICSLQFKEDVKSFPVGEELRAMFRPSGPPPAAERRSVTSAPLARATKEMAPLYNPWYDQFLSGSNYNYTPLYLGKLRPRTPLYPVFAPDYGYLRKRCDVIDRSAPIIAIICRYIIQGATCWDVHDERNAP